jgi:heme exporter protein D
MLALSESATAVLLAVIAGVISIATIVSTTIRARWQMQADMTRRRRGDEPEDPGTDHQTHTT